MLYFFVLRMFLCPFTLCMCRSFFILFCSVNFDGRSHTSLSFLQFVDNFYSIFLIFLVTNFFRSFRITVTELFISYYYFSIVHLYTTFYGIGFIFTVISLGYHLNSIVFFCGLLKFYLTISNTLTFLPLFIIISFYLFWSPFTPYGNSHDSVWSSLTLLFPYFL